MMIQLAIGLGAGAASALLYFAVISGTALAMALFYVAPLPVIVAGLGWGWKTGLVAALSGAALTGAITAPLLGLAFFIGCSMPAAWLARLTLLGRPLEPDNPSSPIEWYPPERIILWTVGLATAVVLVGAVSMGAGTDAFRQSIGAVLAQVADSGAGAAFGLESEADTAALAGVFATMLPAITAAVWTVTMLLNLWLGARVAIASGLLARPMPRFGDMDYPSLAALAFGASLLLSFVPGLPGIAGGIAASALLVAYFLLGLVVLHTVTRTMPARGLLLAALYLMILVLFWAIPLIAAIGLAESFLRLRQRSSGGAT